MFHKEVIMKTIEISDELHTQLKIRAIHQKKQLKLLVKEIIEKGLKK